jgi:hypothetical protein
MMDPPEKAIIIEAVCLSDRKHPDGSWAHPFSPCAGGGLERVQRLSPADPERHAWRVVSGGRNTPVWIELVERAQRRDHVAAPGLPRRRALTQGSRPKRRRAGCNWLQPPPQRFDRRKPQPCRSGS